MQISTKPIICCWNSGVNSTYIEGAGDFVGSKINVIRSFENWQNLITNGAFKNDKMRKIISKKCINLITSYWVLTDIEWLQAGRDDWGQSSCKPIAGDI